MTLLFNLLILMLIYQWLKEDFCFWIEYSINCIFCYKICRSWPAMSCVQLARTHTHTHTHTQREIHTDTHTPTAEISMYVSPGHCMHTEPYPISTLLQCLCCIYIFIIQIELYASLHWQRVPVKKDHHKHNFIICRSVNSLPSHSTTLGFARRAATLAGLAVLVTVLAFVIHITTHWRHTVVVMVDCGSPQLWPHRNGALRSGHT